MFDFGNANDGQRQAISTTEGPVLITAVQVPEKPILWCKELFI